MRNFGYYLIIYFIKLETTELDNGLLIQATRVVTGCGCITTPRVARIPS